MDDFVIYVTLQIGSQSGEGELVGAESQLKPFLPSDIHFDGIVGDPGSERDGARAVQLDADLQGEPTVFQ